MRALAATRERYPDFEAHHFIDGDRIGERRICFESEANALSTSFISSKMWYVITEQNLEVSEAWFSEPCNWLGLTASQIKGDASKDSIKEGCLRFTVVRNVDEMTKERLGQIVGEIRQQGFPTVSDDKLKFDWKDIKADLIELSDPELVALNWGDARPVPTAADFALERAVSELNIQGIRKALADGANPNLTESIYDNNFGALFIAWGDHLWNYSTREKDVASRGGAHPERKIPVEEIKAMCQVLLEAGAHPNYFDYGEAPSLVSAVLAQNVELVRFLLDHGADPSISPFWDDIGHTPAAWDYARFDGFALDEIGARECYYEMVKTHPAPFGSRESEEKDRRDAELPDHLRDWRKSS